MRLLPSLDTAALRHLVGLRFRLQWARARTREGRVVLLVAGGVALGVGAVLAYLGGVGAAVAAVRAGRGSQVALGLLLIFYLFSIALSLFLGIGINGTFSIAMLRRYPLSSTDRFVARHLTAVLDPLWLVCLALDLGVAIGFSALGVTSAWLAVPAALLLVVTNWLAARLLRGAAEWIVATRMAPVLIGVLAIASAALPSLLRGQPAAVHAVSLAISVTPPAAAARLMAGSLRIAPVVSFAALLAWAVALAWAVVGFDRLPVRSRGGSGARVAWGGPLERVGNLFRPPLGPLVVKMLRYYARSPQVKWNFPFVLPMLAAVWLGFSGQWQGLDAFLYALGTLAAVGFLCTGAMSLNLFGFDGSGFRRYFLLPAPAGLAVRAAAIVAVLPGAVLVTVALAAWMLVRPIPTDARMLVMLAASGFGGLLLLQAVSLWAAVLWPRPARFSQMFGNRLSPAGGVLLCAGIGVVFGLPAMLSALGGSVVVRAWLAWPLFAGVSCAFYAFTHVAAPRVFAARRERMMAAVEGTPGGNWLMG